MDLKVLLKQRKLQETTTIESLPVAATNESETHGFLTRQDVKKLKAATRPIASPHRKRSYHIWTCRSCQHEFHYGVLSCPLCESHDIEKTVKQTTYVYEEESP